VQFLKTLATDEIYATTDPHTLFRGNSLCSKALDFFINFIANDYLRKTVGEIIVKLADADEVCVHSHATGGSSEHAGPYTVVWMKLAQPYFFTLLP
jgi:hypothetical protein